MRFETKMGMMTRQRSNVKRAASGGDTRRVQQRKSALRGAFHHTLIGSVSHGPFYTRQDGLHPRFKAVISRNIEMHTHTVPILART